MSVYRTIISDTTGVTDASMLDRLEEEVRALAGGTLDRFTRRQLASLAHTAYSIVVGKP